MLLRALGAEKQRLSLYYAQCVEFYRYFAPLPPDEGVTWLAYFYKKRAQITRSGSNCSSYFIFYAYSCLGEHEPEEPVFANYESFLQIVFVSEYSGQFYGLLCQVFVLRLR
jgi:hypothetical protein